jgi:hypothetical protein
MAIVQTDLRNSFEWARRIRFEPALPITATNVQDAISQAAAFALPPVPTAVNFAMSPYTVVAADRVLLVDTAGGAITIKMMAAAARNGLDLTIKDDTGHAAGANAMSVVMNGAETTDGLAPYPIDSNFSAVKFVPQAGGYYVAP